MRILIWSRFSTTLIKVGCPLLLLLSTLNDGWASTQPPDVNVSMDYLAPYYSPALAIVPDGVSIHVVNPTSSPHSLTHDGCRRAGSCAFDTGAIQPGQEFTIPSLPPGRYSYYCVLHPIMKGEIIVIPDHTEINQGTTHDHRTATHAKETQ